jgi:hypothetical protein
VKFESEAKKQGLNRDIKRVSIRSNRGIFAVTKSGYSSNKVFFGIGRYIKEESKSVA